MSYNHLTVQLCRLVSALSVLSLLGNAQQLNQFTDIIQQRFHMEKLDQCFCELAGQVAECCCDVETVENLNRGKIFPLISSLVNQTYFKFYRVNLHKGCPFWPDDGRCVLKDCHVEKCSEDEIPDFLREAPPEIEKTAGSHVIESCDKISDEQDQLSTVDSTINFKQRETFQMWQEHDYARDSFCQIEDESSNHHYVDLTLNPERFTGYAGHSTQRIWRAIYHENCFRPDRHEDVPPSLPLFHTSLLQEMCLEKRAFFRLVSGLQTSISIHLCALHFFGKASDGKGKFGPNLNEFVRRFDVVTTEGQGPSWLKNLYFAYLLVLRAVAKAEDYWQDHRFYTGNSSEDEAVRDRVKQIVQAAKGCSSLFDESMMFIGDTAQQLKKEFKVHFKNISQIMDCVGCDKCRLWGKLQVKGVGTALKILFSGRSNGAPLHLSRSETVALFNVLGRFSSSINYLQQFRKMDESESAGKPLSTKSTPSRADKSDL